MILTPFENFTIVRGLEDWNDSTQYYVQAVVRNAQTDKIIATVNLTDQGDHRRYSKAWQVAADPTGLGFYISIITSVYTDPGYTTRAATYGDKYEEHLIDQRWNRSLMNSFAGAGDISYSKVRKLIEEELAKIPKYEPKEIDFSPLSNALQAILSEVRAIDIPKFKEADLRPILAKFDVVEGAIRRIVIPEPSIVDLSSILERIDALKPVAVDTDPRLNSILDALVNVADELKAVRTLVTPKPPTPPKDLSKPAARFAKPRLVRITPKH